MLIPLHARAHAHGGDHVTAALPLASTANTMGLLSNDAASFSFQKAFSG
jgi:hypothetical protein